MMTLKEMLLEKKIDQAERLGCLMAMVDESVAAKILEFNKKLIKDEDLYHEINKDGKDEYGREENCHITIRYGFTKDLNELDVRQLLKGHKEFQVELYELDMFTDNPNFDVIKFKVKSPILNQLNEISGIYQNHNDYPDYLPHLTLGYVKKGTFPNLKKRVELYVPIKSVEYSPISGEKSYFELETDINEIVAFPKIDVRIKESRKQLDTNSPEIKDKWLKMKQSLSEITVKLTKEDAQEVLHKIVILNDNPDLQSDYGISQDQSNLLLNTIPHNGGDWNIPDWAVPAVKGEIENHITVLRDIAQDAYNGGQTGQSLRINKQAKRLEMLFGNLLNESALSMGYGSMSSNDIKLRPIPGSVNDSSDWNRDVDDWDGIVNGDNWFVYKESNDHQTNKSGASVTITEDEIPYKIWIKIKTHGLRKTGDTNETHKARIRKHTNKIASKWISAAKKLHEIELNEVGNEIKKSWKESFKNSIESIKSYICEYGEHEIDTVNFTYRK
jgi:2'-5' RNA ligase